MTTFFLAKEKHTTSRKFSNYNQEENTTDTVGINDVSALETQKHPFHVLTDSKLPLFIASVAGMLALTFVYKLHNADRLLEEIMVLKFLVSPFFVAGDVQFVSTNLMILFFIIVLVGLMLSWTYRLLEESSFNHTKAVQTDIKHGMLLFLISEAMLFFPFFWAFFHGALSPSIMIGGVWPPVGIKGLETLNPFLLPLVNTVVLLCSGVAVVCAHRAIIHGYKTVITNALFVAVTFGLLFSWLQFLEYGLTKFTINDGLYGSVFFMLTGLHGFHVIVGTALLILSYWRNVNGGFSTTHHIGFETAAWYWHFVDVVWLGVFAFVYIWGI